MKYFKDQNTDILNLTTVKHSQYPNTVRNGNTDDAKYDFRGYSCIIT